MTTKLSGFISSLRPIESYQVSGCVPQSVNVYLCARSCDGGRLLLQGRRSGWLNQTITGTLMTPCGQVSFHGTRGFISGAEHVALTHSAGDASGQLMFPKLWGIFSCFNRASLSIHGTIVQSFDIWRPRVRFDETIGRFRPCGGATSLYRLFSHSEDATMFDDKWNSSPMQDDEACILLAAILYLCMHPAAVMDRD